MARSRLCLIGLAGIVKVEGNGHRRDGARINQAGRQAGRYAEQSTGQILAIQPGGTRPSPKSQVPSQSVTIHHSPPVTYRITQSTPHNVARSVSNANTSRGRGWKVPQRTSPVSGFSVDFLACTLEHTHSVHTQKSRSRSRSQHTAN